MSRRSMQDIEKAIAAIREDPHLSPASVPSPPILTSLKSTASKLWAIQQYMNALEYNYTGTNYFDLGKNRSFQSIAFTARQIVSEALPIQCLEAVFLSAYLTAEVKEVDRYPLSFKSKAKGQVYRHIVLAVKEKDKWGALGLSRSNKLMYKELKYKSMAELIEEFALSYEECYHELLKIYIGLPFSHDIHAQNKVEWRVLNIRLQEQNVKSIEGQLERFARESKDLSYYISRMGSLPSDFQKRFPCHCASKHKKGGANETSQDNAICITGWMATPSTSTSKASATALKKSNREGKKHEINPLLVQETLEKDSREEKSNADRTRAHGSHACLSCVPNAIVFENSFKKNDGCDEDVQPKDVFLRNQSNVPLNLTLTPPPSGLFGILLRSSETGQLQCSTAPVDLTIQSKGMLAVALRFLPHNMKPQEMNQTVEMQDKILVKVVEKQSELVEISLIARLQQKIHESESD